MSVSRFFLLVLLAGLPLMTLALSKKAEECHPAKCKIPDCFCGGLNPPGGLRSKDIPQFVTLTFDDGVTAAAMDEVFSITFNGQRKNPNGCPIPATFFVSQEFTVDQLVRNLYYDGHEIASHSINHLDGTWFSVKEWHDEIVGQAEHLVSSVGIHERDLPMGMRPPLLNVGGDNMYEMIEQSDLMLYDSSLMPENPSWPYNLKFRHPGRCTRASSGHCPVNSHPGVWEIPPNPITGDPDASIVPCGMGDSCGYVWTDDDTYIRTWESNFHKFHYYGGLRVPFPMTFHAAFFQISPRGEKLREFIDYLLTMPDVYFVTYRQLLEWTKNPVPLSEMKNSPIFACDYDYRRHYPY